MGLKVEPLSKSVSQTLINAFTVAPALLSARQVRWPLKRKH